MTPPPAAPPRYRLILPPGFLLFPVRDRTDAEISQMVHEHYRSLPRDSFGPRIDRVAEQILSVARPARDSAVVDLIVPMGVPWRAPVSVATALSVTVPASAAEWEGLAGERVDTQAGPAVREETSHPAPSDADDISRRRTVQFTWRIPEDDRLLVAVSTVSAAGDPELDPLVDGLVELSDLMMTTMRWDDPASSTPREDA